MTPQTPDQPSLARLFGAAFRVGLMSFGGGVSGWVFRTYVVRNKWIAEGDFLSDMAIARILPGTNSSNIIALLGYRLMGLKGALSGLAGLLVGPFVCVSAMYFSYRYLEGPVLSAALEGAATAALGPLSYLMLRGVQFSSRRWYGAVVLAVIVIAALLKIPLLLIVSVGLCVSFALVHFFGNADVKQ